MSFLGCTDGNTGVCVTGQGQGFDAWFGLGASLVSVKPLDYTGALAAAKRLGLSFKAARTHLHRGLRLLVGLHGHRLLRFKCAGPRRPRAARLPCRVMGLTLLWELVSNREHIHLLLRADTILVGIYAKGGGWADSVSLVDSAGGSLAVYLECHPPSDV